MLLSSVTQYTDCLSYPLVKSQLIKLTDHDQCNDGTGTVLAVTRR